MPGKLRMSALTPAGPLFEGEADMVIVRTVEGEMGILPGHESCAALLAEGNLNIHVGSAMEVFTVLGGFLTVERDKVVVLSTLAARPDKIADALADLERQQLASKRDEARSELEVSRAQTAIRRALVGQEVSAYAVLGNYGEDGRPLEENNHEQP